MCIDVNPPHRHGNVRVHTSINKKNSKGKGHTPPLIPLPRPATDKRTGQTMGVNPVGTGGHVPPRFGKTPIDFRFLHSKFLMEVAMPPPHTRGKIDASGSDGCRGGPAFCLSARLGSCAIISGKNWFEFFSCANSTQWNQAQL